MRSLCSIAVSPSFDLVTTYFTVLPRCRTAFRICRLIDFIGYFCSEAKPETICGFVSSLETVVSVTQLHTRRKFNSQTKRVKLCLTELIRRIEARCDNVQYLREPTVGKCRTARQLLATGGSNSSEASYAAVNGSVDSQNSIKSKSEICAMSIERTLKNLEALYSSVCSPIAAGESLDFEGSLPMESLVLISDEVASEYRGLAKRISQLEEMGAAGREASGSVLPLALRWQARVLLDLSSAGLLKSLVHAPHECDPDEFDE